MKAFKYDMMRFLLILFSWLAFSSSLFAQENPTYSQKEVIYGRKDGMALTMIVLTPKVRANGRGIISLTSQGWTSTADWIPLFSTRAEPLLLRGYTVFIVLHGSQPKYSVPEIASDVRRAVRFVRYNARQYQIDPDRIGITGRSAGGHLSLLMGVKEEAPNPEAKDSVDRASGRVQAVACFYPPTDMLNWSKPGESLVLDKPRLADAGVRGAFEFSRWDTASKTIVPITDTDQQLEITRQLSPLYFVSPDDPPTMIAHGDADKSVPLQQSERLIQKLREVNVPCQLLIKKGKGHTWPDEEVEIKAFADWFDKYLK